MIKKQYYDWADIERACLNIALQMYNDNWKPDYIVGITRGGNVPATILSNMLNIRCEALKVSLRDSENGSESNCWMSEDAFGYISGHDYKTSDSFEKKNILVVDDINDTGATFNWIKQDWQASCMPRDPSWSSIWGNNVRFATIVNNIASPFEINYSSIEINKAEKDTWVVFPYEEWW